MKFVLPGLALFALLLTGPSGTALAQPSTPQEQLRFKNLTVARANPLGLISVTDGSYRFRLYESDSPLFKDNFIGVGGQVVLTPAFFRIGPMLEIQPLSILYLQATFESIDYFGSFGFFQSFAFATDDFSDSAIDDLEASDDPDARNYSTSGWQFSGLAEFRFKVGPMAVRDTFRAGRPDYDVRDGDQLYYEPLFDLLIPNGGWFVNNDVDLLYLTGRWKLGARWTYATAFYRDGAASRSGSGRRTPTTPPIGSDPF